VIYISQASVGADATFTVPMRVSVVLFIAAIGLFARLCRLPISSHGQNIDRKLGNITYALYLTHPAIIALAVALHWDGHFGRPVTFILVVVGSLLMSVGVFQGVERPVMQLRDSFRGRRLYRS